MMSTVGRVLVLLFFLGTPLAFLQQVGVGRSVRRVALTRLTAGPRATLRLSATVDAEEARQGPTTTGAKESARVKLAKRWATGLSLGAVCTLWIFSGNGPFTLLFLIVSLIAQSEYYQMVQNKQGILPTKKIGMVSLLMSYTTAAMFPQYHEAVMPLSATILMLWLLVFNKKSALISEISTSLLGMFYIGYLPSFWVRLKTDAALGIIVPWMPPLLLQKLPWLKAHEWTVGSILTWWTWTSIVFADVGAYFIGKNFGKHKLNEISQAAGAASPNKTIEGALGGFASCMSFAVLGAHLMRWPYPLLTGAAYGLLISFIALVGDLTASMMKRDAGLKDSGNILPGHGGLLDRIDSYMFTAPFAYYFLAHFVPHLAKISRLSKRLPPIALSLGGAV